MKQKLDINELNEKIFDKKIEFFDEYRQEPQYIKIPIWVYVLLREQYLKVLGYSYKDKNEKLFGLKIIPTPTIMKINEIELL